MGCSWSMTEHGRGTKGRPIPGRCAFLSWVTLKIPHQLGFENHTTIFLLLPSLPHSRQTGTSQVALPAFSGSLLISPSESLTSLAHLVSASWRTQTNTSYSRSNVLTSFSTRDKSESLRWSCLRYSVVVRIRLPDTDETLPDIPHLAYSGYSIVIGWIEWNRVCMTIMLGGNQ